MTKEKVLPIRISRKLAKAVGLKESLFVTRIIELSRLSNDNVKKHDDLIWIRRSLKEWHIDFDFLTADTINRSLIKLRKKNIIYAENLNADRRDSTLWYALNTLEIDFLITGDTGSAEWNERLNQEKLQKDKL